MPLFSAGLLEPVFGESVYPGEGNPHEIGGAGNRGGGRHNTGLPEHGERKGTLEIAAVSPLGSRGIDCRHSLRRRSSRSLAPTAGDSGC